MTKSVKVANQNDNLITWLRQMSNERFRHLPVVDKKDNLIGVVSIGDLVRDRTKRLKKEIDQLKNYVTKSY